AMTLRRLGCALCMPFISPFRSPFRPYNRAYAYRGLTNLRSAFHGGQRVNTCKSSSEFSTLIAQTHFASKAN
ncbi:MAG: hypothetical protein KZQ60_19995, partial [Candidatus Thiodiazotropha sp. (ex Lucinoma aequizonata)]|nr:hypothetical protein [Candidatus Thiodiazotropha sp. (ex Lucinoma aequizonata)]